MNILFLTNRLDYTDGVSSHLYYLLKGLKKNSSLNMQINCSGGDALEKFADLDIEILTDKNLNHEGRSVKSLTSAVISTSKLIKKKKIDIIHSHNHYAANIGYLSSKFSGADTIQTNHGLLPEKGFLKHFKARKYIAVNEHIQEYMLENKITSEKNINLIRYGLPYEEFNKDKSSQEIKIICAARLIYEKGVDTFIKCAALLAGENKFNFKFYLAGSGDVEKELKKLNEKLKAKVKFMGSVKTLTDTLKGTDIFVIPTRSSSEGFPMSIIEAAFAKNLIITSGFRGLNSIFTNQSDGLTFEINDHRELSRRILFAAENQNERKLMTEHFHRKALKLFDIKVMIQKHEALYKSVYERN